MSGISMSELMQKMENVCDQSPSGDGDCISLFHQHADLINTLNSAGWTPLRLCVTRMNDENAARHAHELLRLGANQRLGAKKGNLVPIHEAARLGKLKTVQALGAADGDIVNLQTDKGLNVLHYAAEAGSVDIVSFLLQSGANPNALTLDGNTAAHYAGATNHRDVLEILINAGTDLCIVNNSGFTAHGKLWENRVKAAAERIRQLQETANVPTDAVRAVFPDLSVEDCQELLDAMTEQRPTEWDDNVLFYFAAKAYARHR